MDKKVRDCTIFLSDGKLIAKLSAGDLVALEAKYHTACLVSFYNQVRNRRSASLRVSINTTSDLEELAFAQLVAYIDEKLASEEIPMFKMSELTKFFSSKLEELEVDLGRIHTSIFFLIKGENLNCFSRSYSRSPRKRCRSGLKRGSWRYDKTSKKEGF